MNLRMSLLWILPITMLLIGVLDILLELSDKVGEPFRAWAFYESSFGSLLAIAMLTGDNSIRRSSNLSFKLKVLRQCVTGGLVLLGRQVILNVRAGVLLANAEGLKDSVVRLGGRKLRGT